MQPQALDRQVLEVLGPKENGNNLSALLPQRRTNLAILVFWYSGILVFWYPSRYLDRPVCTNLSVPVNAAPIPPKKGNSPSPQVGLVTKGT